MIHAVLRQHPTEPELLALDSAIGRGDFLTARELATHLYEKSHPVTAGANLRIRLAGLEYYSNQYAAVFAWLEVFPERSADSRFQQGCAHFLRAMAAVEQRVERDARTELEQARQQWRSQPKTRLYCRLADGLLAHYLNRYDEATQILNNVQDEFERCGDAWGYWQTKRINGLALYERTNYVEALDMLTGARVAFHDLGDRYEVARCDKAIASTQRRLENQTEATAHIERSIAYFAAQQMEIPYARCMTTLGGIQFYFNEQERALKSFQIAARSLENTGLKLELAHAVANVGLCNYWMGHNRLALRAYNAAKELAEQVGSLDAIAHFVRYLANILWQDDQMEEAVQAIRIAAKSWSGLGVDAQAAACWRMEAEYLLEMGDLVRAEELLTLSSKTFLTHERPTQAALASITLAHLRFIQGQLESAIDLLLTCDQILRRHNRSHQAARANILLGQIYLEMGKDDLAKAQFQQGLDSAPPERIASAWRAYYGLAKIAAKNLNGSLAIDFLQQALSNLSRLRRGRLSPRAAAGLAKDSLPVYVMTIDLTLQIGEVIRSLAVLEDHKALQLSQQMNQNADESAAAELSVPPTVSTRTKKSLHLEELRAAIQRAQELEDWRSVNVLEQRFQHLAEELSVENAPYISLYAPPAIDLPILRESLDARYGIDNWGCLSYGWFAGETVQLYRFWLDSSRSLASPTTLSALDQHLLALYCRPETSYRRRILEWSSDRSRSAEWDRVQNLMIPVTWQPHIRAIDTLYVLPSGPLNSFPWAALSVDDDLLGLTKRLGQIPSLPLLQTILSCQSRPNLHQRQSLSQTKGLVFAVPAYPNPEKHPPLSAAGEEAIHLRHLLSSESDLFVGERATVAAFKSLEATGALSTYELIHLAAHSLLHPYHSHLCHIALYDSNLYIAEILQLRFNARLVSLAACDTAIGHVMAGDEQMGLPHAFLVAGADTLLASLWPINDQLSAAFFSAFYAAYSSEKVSPGEALLHARQTLAEKYSSPYSWAAYTLVGLV